MSRTKKEQGAAWEPVIPPEGSLAWPSNSRRRCKSDKLAGGSDGESSDGKGGRSGCYLKTKNVHWHVSGPHFRDYHLLLDEQAAEILGSTDEIAERVRKIGGTTLRSIGHIAKLQRVFDNDADYVDPQDMLAELREDNLQSAARMREAHDLCDEHRDYASASILENFNDQAERRAWFLFEASRRSNSGA